MVRVGGRVGGQVGVWVGNYSDYNALSCKMRISRFLDKLKFQDRAECGKKYQKDIKEEKKGLKNEKKIDNRTGNDPYKFGENAKASGYTVGQREKDL